MRLCKGILADSTQKRSSGIVPEPALASLRNRRPQLTLRVFLTPAVRRLNYMTGAQPCQGNFGPSEMLGDHRRKVPRKAIRLPADSRDGIMNRGSRGVAQLGQRASFGNWRPRVQISPPRPDLTLETAVRAELAHMLAHITRRSLVCSASSVTGCTPRLPLPGPACVALRERRFPG